MTKKTISIYNKEITISPRGSWLLVEPIKDEKTSGGLSLPDSVEKEIKAEGIVLAVGPKVEGISEGDRVIFGKYAGEDLQIGRPEEVKEKVDYKLLLDEDVLAIIER